MAPGHNPVCTTESGFTPNQQLHQSLPSSYILYMYSTAGLLMLLGLKQMFEKNPTLDPGVLIISNLAFC